MLSGEGNENGEKTTICLISKKATLQVQHSFFCTFLYRYLARLQRETSRNFLATPFMKEMSYVFLFTFFPLSLIFTQVAASISYFLTATTKFHVVPLTKNVPFVFFFLTVALFLVELRWPGVAIRFPAKITRHLAPAYMKWVYGRSAFLRYITTKFSRMDSFLIYGAPLAG